MILHGNHKSFAIISLRYMKNNLLDYFISLDIIEQ